MRSTFLGGPPLRFPFSSRKFGHTARHLCLWRPSLSKPFFFLSCSHLCHGRYPQAATAFSSVISSINDVLARDFLGCDPCFLCFASSTTAFPSRSHLSGPMSAAFASLSLAAATFSGNTSSAAKRSHRQARRAHHRSTVSDCVRVGKTEPECPTI